MATSRSRRGKLLAALVIAIGLAVPASASAYGFTFYNGNIGAYNDKSGSSIAAYRITYGYSDGYSHKVAVAAHYAGDGNAIIGSYVDGWYKACHSYSGTESLGGKIKNPHSVTIPFQGESIYNQSDSTCSSIGFRSAASTPESGDPSGSIAEVPADVKNDFAVFAKAPADVPATVRRDFGAPGPERTNLDLARAIRTVAGTGWVVPGDGYLCLIAPDPVDGYGYACTPTQLARQKGAYIGLSDGKVPSGKKWSTTLVPTGASVSQGKGRPVDVQDDGVVSAEIASSDEIVVVGK